MYASHILSHSDINIYQGSTKKNHCFENILQTLRTLTTSFRLRRKIMRDLLAQGNVVEICGIKLTNDDLIKLFTPANKRSRCELYYTSWAKIINKGGNYPPFRKGN